MKLIFFLIFLFLISSFSEAKPNWLWVTPPSCEDPTLKLVHVVFRHGNRNPEESTLWPGNQFTDPNYYPDGFGQLTNEGKRTEYNLGKLLRNRYDTFLGDIWNINYLEVRSTDYNRTKMSAQLVLAGLWPPRGPNIWNPELPWQPIPYNYNSSDPILQGFNCPAFDRELNAVLASDEISNYLSERYGNVMEVFNEETGLDLDDYLTAGFSYHDAMKVQISMGLPLPEWAYYIYPEPLHSLAVDVYYLWTNTTTLRRYIAGGLVSKILNDTRSFINGTLSPPERKMFLYSGHDINIGTLLPSLEAYHLTNTPPYGAAIIFEVHEFEGVYGLKLFYVDYIEGSPHPLAIPGCNHFCPFEEFYSLVEEILPTPNMPC